MSAAHDALRRALGSFDWEREEAGRRQERAAREREVVTRNPPPGTRIWRVGKEYVVTKDGLEEVPR
jgi:hypothetical protein